MLATLGNLSQNMHKNILHGCIACPLLQSDTNAKAENAAAGGTSLEDHVDSEHIEVTNWKSMWYKWGDRLTQPDGTFKDIPESDRNINN